MSTVIAPAPRHYTSLATRWSTEGCGEIPVRKLSEHRGKSVPGIVAVWDAKADPMLPRRAGDPSQHEHHAGNVRTFPDRATAYQLSCAGSPHRGGKLRLHRGRPGDFDPDALRFARFAFLASPASTSR